MRVLMFFTIGFVYALVLKLSVFSFFTIACVSLLGMVSAQVHFNIPEPRKSFGIILIGSGFGLCYLYTYSYIFHEPLKAFDNTMVEVQAELLEYPSQTSYSYTVMAKLELPSGSKVKSVIYTDEQVDGLKPGDTFFATVNLSFTDITSKGIATNYYLERGILLRGVTQGDLEVMKNKGTKFRHIPAELSEKLKNAINHGFPSTYSGLMLALVTGNKDDLSDEFQSGLSRTGLSHTVAVSGMHLGFLATILWTLLPIGRTWTLVVFCISMMLFMFMSGCTPSIMRATVMIIMLYIAPLFRRSRDNATALSAAIIFILLQNPYAITQVGLHLSVASVISIFIFAEPVKKHCMASFSGINNIFITKCLEIFFTAIGTTLSAMILTTPLVAKYFQTVSIIAPIANFLVLGAVSFCFAGGFLVGIVTMFFPGLGSILALPFLPVVAYLQWVIPFLGHRPFAAVNLESIYYTIWLYFSYSILIVYLYYQKEKRVYYPVLSSVTVFAMMTVFHGSSIYKNDLTGQVLNVGQGQSALFVVGNQLVVSDCGGSAYKNAGDMVADAINDMGRSDLGFLVLSHCDADHANGVIQLMNRLSVGTIAMPPSDPEHSLQQEIIKKAREKGTEVLFVEEYLEYSLENRYTMRLYPPVGSGSTNESGITLMLSLGEQDILITGDIGIQTETALFIEYGLSDIEILFIGHHGSRYSTGTVLLDKTTPEVAIISVGENNSYGHPSLEVLDKLEVRNMEIYRTDLLGTFYFYLNQ